MSDLSARPGLTKNMELALEVTEQQLIEAKRISKSLGIDATHNAYGPVVAALTQALATNLQTIRAS